jgi:membrane protein
MGLYAAHWLLPAKQQRVRDIIPGVMVTTLVWVVVALVYSYYLVSFSTFTSTYASLSGLFAAMFFLYLSALVLLLGGEFNRVLQIHRMRRAAAKLQPAP